MERRTYRNTERKSPQKRFLFVWGIAFVALFLLMGLAVIFNVIDFRMPLAYRISFGVLLIVYSVFRCYRLMKNE